MALPLKLSQQIILKQHFIWLRYPFTEVLIGHVENFMLNLMFLMQVLRGILSCFHWLNYILNFKIFCLSIVWKNVPFWQIVSSVTLWRRSPAWDQSWHFDLIPAGKDRQAVISPVKRLLCRTILSNGKMLALLGDSLLYVGFYLLKIHLIW